jgi:sugar O-acyltransferase (sialic acid O-acetyltransferase NeuD family)
MELYGLIGAGGFGREVMPLARPLLLEEFHGTTSPTAELVFVAEDGYLPASERVNGYRVLSMSQFLSSDATVRRFNIAIGDSKVRERIANSISPDLATPFSIEASTMVNFEGNSIGEGAIFCSFSHVLANVRIGRYFHCNVYSYVAHDCVIGDFVTFAPAVKCNGHVIVEDHAYIGTGAIIKDGTEKPIVIGRGAVVGMGAVVTKSVPAGATVVGNPARILE